MCEVCRSSCSSFCGHDCAYRWITCVPHISGDVNETISASPTRRGTATLHEFQFFQQHEGVPWLLSDVGGGGLGQKEMASGSKGPNHLCDSHKKSPCLSFDVFSSSIGSKESPRGSPVEVPVMGQLGSSATPISYSSSSMATTNASMTMGREARVQRYREKKKRRKFEKKIRYQSRKASADRRPRIKGRFAKKLESDEQAAPPPYTFPDLHGTGWFQL
ncbi:hypothetical protein MRB53_025486 [Persea americana]|uniref:Uncharacterized protein n=1 Tax=Persea americana TaxID=3435 RepID=A0ACC2LFX7_PERAE|nr:hypothetical protein MRB53_025486 [Persea americana]